MTFVKGVGSKIYKNVGRKGFEWEQAQLEQMRKILGKDLKILERLQDENITPEDEKRLQLAQSRILKIMDKLHVSKTQTDITSGGEKIEKINYIIPTNGNNAPTNIQTTSGK